MMACRHDQKIIDDLKAVYQAERDARHVSKLGHVTASLDGQAKAWESGACVTGRHKTTSAAPLGRIIEKSKILDQIIPDQQSRFGVRFGRPGDDTNRARKRTIRRRTFGSWSDMPYQLRYHYTEGERAALHVVTMVVVKHGYCDLSLQEIADVAGVSRSTAKSALTEARKLGHVAVTYRKRDRLSNHPNVVTIISAEWLNWVKTLAVKKMSTLKRSGDRKVPKGQKEPFEWALEREIGDLFSPLNQGLHASRGSGRSSGPPSRQDTPRGVPPGGEVRP